MRATDLAHVFVEYHNKTNIGGLKNYINLTAMRTYASEMYDALKDTCVVGYAETRTSFIASFLEEVSFLLER